MQRPTPEQVLPPGEVSDVLREILAGPDFATFGEAARWSLWGWVLRKLGELWAWLRQFVGEDATVAQVLVILVVLALLVVAVMVASRHAPRWLGQTKDGDATAAPPAPVTAREWLAIATEQAGRGELRPAATALYQGFLLTLDGNGALSFHGSKTPGDYAREIAGTGGGSAATAGGVFLDSFQDFSFGQERATTGGYAGLARLARDAGCPAATPETEPGSR